MARQILNADRIWGEPEVSEMLAVELCGSSVATGFEDRDARLVVRPQPSLSSARV